MGSINSFSIWERMKLGSLTSGAPGGASAAQGAEALIASLEWAAQNHPSEWVIYYVLGDKYQEVARYTDSLKACQRCVELRPSDIRSAYALGTAYNMLTRAAWSTRQEMQAVADAFRLAGNLDRIDPLLSQAALDQNEMLLETAALQAIRWFERALALRPDVASCTMIGQDLSSLYQRFPKLKR